MEDMSAVAMTNFDTNYELHQKHLKLKGLQPGGVSRNPRKFRHPNSNPATSASRSITLPLLRKV